MKRSLLDQLEDALIDAEGSAFLLSLVESHLPEGGEDHDRAVTIIEGHLSHQMAELRKAFDKFHAHAVKSEPPPRIGLALVQAADGRGANSDRLCSSEP